MHIMQQYMLIDSIHAPSDTLDLGFKWHTIQLAILKTNRRENKNIRGITS